MGYMTAEACDEVVAQMRRDISVGVWPDDVKITAHPERIDTDSYAMRVVVVWGDGYCASARLDECTEKAFDSFVCDMHSLLRRKAEPECDGVGKPPSPPVATATDDAPDPDRKRWLKLVSSLVWAADADERAKRHAMTLLAGMECDGPIPSIRNYAKSSVVATWRNSETGAILDVQINPDGLVVVNPWIGRAQSCRSRKCRDSRQAIGEARNWLGWLRGEVVESRNPAR